MSETEDKQELLRIETFEAIQSAANVQAAVEVFRDAYPIGHVVYHLAQTIAGKTSIDTPFVKTTYPAAWVGHYVMNGYANVDPVVEQGTQRMLPFLWSELEPGKEAIDLFTDFQNFGLDPRGFSIPLVDSQSKSTPLSNRKWV